MYDNCLYPNLIFVAIIKTNITNASYLNLTTIMKISKKSKFKNAISNEILKG